MTGLVRRATLLSAAGVLAASAAMAGVPSATTSVQPTGLVIKVVARSLSSPDPAGNITYTIRDASNNAVPGSVVILNFASCTDVRVCSAQVGSGMSVNCGAHTVTGVTNASGQVTMVVSGTSTTAGPFLATKCVSVTADGVPFSNLNAATPDYDGSTATGGTGNGLGTDLIDVGICYGDKNNFPSRLRSDMDGDGDVDLIDVGAVYGIKNGGGSPTTCSAFCP
jgi:hypothetical protein